MGFEPTPSALQRRQDTLLKISGSCEIPANHRIPAWAVFSAFQEIYSGCCMVAAHDQKDAIRSCALAGSAVMVGYLSRLVAYGLD